MQRRDFLKGTAALTAGSAASAATGGLFPAAAQARKDTLLSLSESGPNNLDIHGVGTNRPGYEASWNVYDRLVTFGVKKDVNDVDHYDYSKPQPQPPPQSYLPTTPVTVLPP